MLLWWWVLLSLTVDSDEYESEDEASDVSSQVSKSDFPVKRDFAAYLQKKSSSVQSTRPLARRGWENIPRDCLERVIIVGNIFGTKSLTNIGSVCRNWRTIVNQDHIWKRVMEKKLA